MKKLLLLTVLVGGLAGAFFAIRWFRGDSAYEDAVEDMEGAPLTPA